MTTAELVRMWQGLRDRVLERPDDRTVADMYKIRREIDGRRGSAPAIAFNYEQYITD